VTKYSMRRFNSVSACGLLLALLASSAYAETNKTSNTPVFAAITVNGEEVADLATILMTSDCKVFIPKDLLAKLRLEITNPETLLVGDDEFYRVDNLPNTEVTFDNATQTLKIVAKGSAFNGTTYNLNKHKRRNVQAPPLGGYLNYDLTYSHYTNGYNFGALLDANVFGLYGGELESREIYKSTPGTNSFYRLDTKYVKDFPDSITTLTLGDSITVPSNWSTPVYFGGIQYSTNFSIRPDIVSTPLPTLSGVAQAPSTVNLYVNSLLRSSTQVNTGPFAISNVPVFTGAGNVQMVVQNALGQQQVISQPFITSSTMLVEGTHAESVEAGALRENYGFVNSRYAQAFASGTFRYGFKYLTAETHAEVSSTSQDVGVGSTFAFFNSLLLTSSVAGSMSKYGSGGLVQLQLSRQGRLFGFAVSDTITTKNYLQLGYDNDNRPSSHQFLAQGYVSLGAHASASLNYLDDANRNSQNVKAVGAGVTFDLGRYGNVSLSVSKELSGSRTTTGSAIWVIPFGNQSVASSEIDFAPHDTDANFEVSKTPEIEGGWGYRARTTVINNDSQDVGATYLSNVGQYDVEANHTAGQVNEQVEATGGIAELDGVVRPTRWVNSSFAIVEVPIKQNIDVLSNNQVIGHTDGSGVAVIPNLVPYENNNINLDDTEIPLDIDLDLADRIVTPPQKGGYLLKFEAKKVTGATVILVDENDKPLPAGAKVRTDGQEDEQVALNGKVFMPNIELPAVVTASWGNKQCTAKALAPASSIVLPTVGPFICKEQK
jgi:outer membrane usher protein